MAMVVIQCPRTGRPAATGLEMDEETFNALPEVQSRMHCWECGAVHVVAKVGTACSYGS